MIPARARLLRAQPHGLILLAFALLLAGCATTSVPATGEPGQGTTGGSEQSETAVNVSDFGGQQVITVAYNDGTGNDNKILYTATTREVRKGASLAGWSYSTDGGGSWKYGGKVQPPQGWAVLWSDPALTRSQTDQRFVFASYLAMPDSKFPPGGASGPVNAFMGGACILRSADGGVSFQNYQCVDNNLHFYDGGSMAAGIGGEIFAAYVDLNTEQIDVWRSPDSNGAFAMLPPPFPGIVILTHARLRVDASSGDLYVAAQRSDGVVFANRFHNGAWGQPVAVSFKPAVIYPSITLSDRSLRTGPQYSFDVGPESVNANDAVRVIYTARSVQANRFYVRGSFCRRDLSDCRDAAEWGTTPGVEKTPPGKDNLSISGDQFNPVLRTFPGSGPNPVWKLTYLSRERAPNGNTVSIEQGNLFVAEDGIRLFLPFNVIDSHLVCPDQRGYWGDYDDMQLASLGESGAARFIRALSDSSKGCIERFQFTSKHLHVSSAKVN